MKKLLGVLVCVGAIFLSSCGWTDYTYSLLPNDYELWNINAEQTVLAVKDKGSSEVGVNYVEEFCNNERYICVKNSVVEEETGKSGFTNYIKTGEFEYHIVDTEEQTVYGSYATLEDLNAAISNMGIENLCEWTPTWPAPEGAVFPGE